MQALGAHGEAEGLAGRARRLSLLREKKCIRKIVFMGTENLVILLGKRKTKVKRIY